MEKQSAQQDDEESSAKTNAPGDSEGHDDRGCSSEQHQQADQEIGSSEPSIARAREEEHEPAHECSTTSIVQGETPKSIVSENEPSIPEACSTLVESTDPKAVPEAPRAEDLQEPMDKDSTPAVPLVFSGSRKSGPGIAKKPSFPSILGELNLKLTSKGILLPESRRSLLTRRRENNPFALMPVETAAGEGKRRKHRKERLVAVPLDEVSSTLFHAAHTGDRDDCRRALADGAEANVRTNADLDGVGTGATALHVAAARGHSDVIEELLRAGADATVVSGRGEAPIQVATRNGHIEVVRALKRAGASPVDAEGAMQLLGKAPSWDDRKRRQLYAELAPEQRHKGRKYRHADDISQARRTDDHRETGNRGNRGNREDWARNDANQNEGYDDWSCGGGNSGKGWVDHFRKDEGQGDGKGGKSWKGHGSDRRRRGGKKGGCNRSKGAKTGGKGSKW